jgi:mono/diheme cytochrome c family protein
MRIETILALLLAACASAPKGGAAAGPDDPDAAGERLYRSHCGACHRLRDPGEQTRQRWAWAVQRFGARAHLSDEEQQRVLGYLQARARDAAPRQ